MTQGQQPEALRAAAQAVIDRWETPLWKDVPATAEYIAALRDALEADHFEDKLDMVARWYMVDKDGMATLCTDREDAEQEAKDANMAWPHTAPHRAVQLLEVGASAAELHPSPPEGMVGGWRPIETAPKYTENGVSQHLLLGYAPDEIHEDGFVSQGYWMEAEEDAPDNMGHDSGWVDVHFDFFRCGRSFGADAYRSAGTQPTHWMPLPPPPTTSACSKGE